jgi:hypothetical protein
MMRYVILFLLLTGVVSCTIDKRLYRKGYYIQKNHSEFRFGPHAHDVDTVCVAVAERAISSTPEEASSVQPREKDGLSPVTSKSLHAEIPRVIDEDKITAHTPIAVEEEPVQQIKRNDRWKYAGLAVLAAVVGILLGILIAQLYIAPWLAILYAAIVLGAVGYMIYRSIRAHYQYKNAHPEDGKQQPLQWLGRVLLYLLALAGAGIIAVIAVVITALSNW